MTGARLGGCYTPATRSAGGGGCGGASCAATRRAESWRCKRWRGRIGRVPALPCPLRPQLADIVPRGIEGLPIAEARAWAAVVVGGDAHGVAAIARPDGEVEVVAVSGAEHLDELPLGCGEDHGEALCWRSGSKRVVGYGVPALRRWRGAGAGAGGGERRKEPRLLASGALRTAMTQGTQGHRRD